MDNFLEIVCTNQIMGNAEQGDKYLEVFRPFMNKLKDIVSDKVYSELEEIFNDCAAESNYFYAVTGMKLAIGIMNGTYTPAV
jgi:hypothetical protein